jgi:2,3-bisphosphoglycerate-dependent phosphoglycerate mutase
MTRVDLYADCMVWPIGEDSFVRSFFSTVARRLEPQGWGSRFPALMALADGPLAFDRAHEAAQELRTARAELAELPPEARVFEYDHPDVATPWPYPPGASSVADAFVTVGYVNFIDTMLKALLWGHEAKAKIEIRALPEDDNIQRYVITGEQERDS